MLVLPLGIAWFGAVALSLLDGRRPWVGWLAVAVLAGNFGALGWLALLVLRQGPLQVVAGGWPAGVGIVLRLDALGAAFALVSSGVLLASVVYEVLGGVRSRTFPAVALFLTTGLTGLFLTGDVFNFYVFFEVSMAAAYVLTTYGERGPQLRAGTVFVVVNLLGSVLFLTAIGALYHVTGTLSMEGIAARVAVLRPGGLSLIAALLLAAFGVKLGLFPFHFWLPPTYRDTKPAVAALLAGALANVGSYGLLRFGADLLPSVLEEATILPLALGAVSIFYGEILAVSRFPAGEVLAYSSIGQAGYILIALALGGPIGYTAAVVYAIANALNKTTLFLTTGLRGWPSEAAFALGAFSVAGVPPSAGFFGKVALLQASIVADRPPMVAMILVGGILSLVYMFQIYQREFWEDRRPGKVGPLGPRVLVLALAGLIVGLGIWPEPLLALGQQASSPLLEGR